MQIVFIFLLCLLSTPAIADDFGDRFLNRTPAALEENEINTLPEQIEPSSGEEQAHAAYFPNPHNQGTTLEMEEETDQDAIIFE